ncbi:xylulokinase [Clostridia bacterium]|nr:xylulokinase [Clostridia bacterium]
MNYIGIDLGTSAVKLLLMDGTGKILNSVSKSYPLNFPYPGWSEQNPRDWFEATMEGMEDLLQNQDSCQVKALSFGGQMHGLVLLDEKDQVLRPAILWNDGRTEEENDYLNQVIGKEKLSTYTANISFTGFTAAKILWVKKHEPEIFSKIHKIMLPKDYLLYCLTGVHATDYSDASGMLLLDVKQKKWSKEMLEICGISLKQLPVLYESYEVVGKIKEEFSKRLKLSSDVLVAAGAGDNAAAAIGTGTIGEGSCTLSLGTSGTVFISGDSFRLDSYNALHSFAHADGKYHLMGCILSAASCYSWWMENILETQDFEKEQEKIVHLGENPVFFLPYLMGERSPHNDAKAKGAFIGLSMDNHREQMTQAVLEGVAFALRDSLEVARKLGIQISSCKISGGGMKSPLWRKILAAVLQTRLDVVKTSEGPSFGAAILASVAAGEYVNVKEAVAAMVEVIHSEKADPVLQEKYEVQYQKFRQLYPALKTCYAQ